MPITLHANGTREGINNSNFNSSLSPGHVVQTVYAHSATAESVAYNGTLSLTASITPSSTSHNVLVMVTLGLISADSAADTGWNILRDGTALQQGSGGTTNATTGAYTNAGGSYAHSPSLVLLDDEISTTSSVTYSIQGAANSPRTFVVNKRGSDDTLRVQSRITLMEIVA